MLFNFNPRSHEGSDPPDIVEYIEQQISIHAPTRGATALCNSGVFKITYFNPRSHEGSDIKSAVTFIQQTISIHAPTRGATSSKYCCRATIRFQSTLPRGERLSTSPYGVNLLIDFNPRSHEGSDLKRANIQIFRVISIHAPTRGATHIMPPSADFIEEISIHAPTRGATHVVGIPCKAVWDFNPRSHEGSDSNFRQKVLFSLSKNCLKYLILTTNYFN